MPKFFSFVLCTMFPNVCHFPPVTSRTTFRFTCCVISWKRVSINFRWPKKHIDMIKLNFRIYSNKSPVSNISPPPLNLGQQMQIRSNNDMFYDTYNWFITVFPHFVALKRSIVQVSVAKDKNLSYICIKNHEKWSIPPEIFDISLIEKIEALGLILE